MINPKFTRETLISPINPCFAIFFSLEDFCNFLPPVPITKANSSFQNNNWYNKVTSYTLDLTWNFFLSKLFLQKSTFHFLNLSPDLLSIRASNDPKRPRKGNNQLYRADVCIIVVNLKHVSRCLEKSRMAKMAREWLDGIDPVISPQRACAKTVVTYK